MVSVLNAQLVPTMTKSALAAARCAHQVHSKMQLVASPANHAHQVHMLQTMAHKYVLLACKVHTPLVYSKLVTSSLVLQHAACAQLVGLQPPLVQPLALNVQRVLMVHSQVQPAKLAELVLFHHLSNKLNAKFAHQVLHLV